MALKRNKRKLDDIAEASPSKKQKLDDTSFLEESDNEDSDVEPKPQGSESPKEASDGDTSEPEETEQPEQSVEPQEESPDASPEPERQSKQSKGSSGKQTGICKWFGQKGFGFITPDNGGEDLFVHWRSIHASGFSNLAEGEKVEFDAEEGNNGKMQASNVTGPNGDYVKGAPKPDFDDDGRGGGGGGYRGGGGGGRRDHGGGGGRRGGGGYGGGRGGGRRGGRDRY